MSPQGKDCLSNAASAYLLREVLEEKAAREHQELVAEIVRARATNLCACCGCRKVNPNPNGCINKARSDAYQYVSAMAA
jgi:transposase